MNKKYLHDIPCNYVLINTGIHKNFENLFKITFFFNNEMSVKCKPEFVKVLLDFIQLQLCG